MNIQHISSEDRGKAIAILAVFVVALIGSVWMSRQQGWELIFELTVAMVVIIIFAIIYDYFVIR